MKPQSSPRTVIVAALDHSAAQDNVLEATAALARTAPDAEVHVVHVVDAGAPPGNIAIPLTETERAGRELLHRAKALLAERFTGRVAAHLAADVPARYVLQLANDVQADIIVVAPHGKGPLERLFLGSVSQQIVKQASCAVLVARPKEYAPVPEIEPPCPKCVEVQQTTQREQLWCAQHSGKRVRGRVHYQTPEPFGIGSSLLHPTP
ncbi:MAG: universal stress protein [Labilithrix sp.]|nr:universal stress protein [Labilithrix sp.]MCW5836180.1 universal stress protein [Labilithrix sp.]